MEQKKWKCPRPNSMVKVVFHDHIGDYPFNTEYNYVFLGEIPNMPGHCVVVEHERHGKDCQVYTGYHSYLFEELTEDEV